MSVNDSQTANSNTTTSTNWFKRQWNDIKGNVKFAAITTVGSLLLAGAATLIRGIPLWRQIALIIIFLLFLAWALTATLVAVRKPSSAKSPIEIVDGYDSVYDRTLEVLRTATKLGRAVVYTNNLPLAPERFVDGLVGHLKTHPSFKYHVTFIGNLSDVPREFWTTLDLRFKRMEDARVTDQFRISFIDAKNTVGFDTLVLDDKHCCFGFSPIAPTQPGTKRQSSFIFENQPSIAERVRPWLDNLYPLKERDEAREIWNRRQKNK